MRTIMLVLFLTFISMTANAATPEGTAWIAAHGYDRCIELTNGNVRVVLEPNCGGRVMEFSLGGRNVIWVDPEQDGWMIEPGKQSINPSGGRLDIGPEMKAPRRPALWMGPWVPEITGPRSARMTSVEDKSTGVRLIREFELDAELPRLICRQIIENVSEETKCYNHWSRTLATGGGIFLAPLTERSRFPRGYVYYGPGSVLNFNHEDHPHIRVRDGFLEVPGPPPQRKFGIDSYAGWLGYVTTDDMLFVKRFPVYPGRHYGEVAGYTISLWYDLYERTELEPIGPLEEIPPGGRASFTEDWWLFDYAHPGDAMLDLGALERYVLEAARAVVADGAEMKKIASGYTWAEGPVEASDGSIYFTDNRENLVHRILPEGGTERFITDAHRLNGLYADSNGNVLGCAGSPQAVVSIDRAGRMTTVIDSYNGRKLNAPNDLWIAPDGGVYFTDPYWGKEPGMSRVYYLAPDRTTLIPVVMDMVRPNGIIGSPDGKCVYVSDWDEKVTYAFDVAQDGGLYNKRMFAPHGDDGMTVDEAGNVYLTGDRVRVYSPDGVLADEIVCPETPANVIITGHAKNTLLITARTGVYTVKLR